MNFFKYFLKLILVYFANCLILMSANAEQHENTLSNTFESRPLPGIINKDSEAIFLFDDQVLNGPDWNTFLRSLQIRFTQSPRRHVSMLFSFYSESRIEHNYSSKSDVSFKFELLDLQRKVLDTFDGTYKRICGTNLGKVSGWKSSVSYRLADIGWVRISTKHSENVKWCDRGKETIVGSPIFLDPVDFIFSFPARKDDTHLRITTVAGVKYQYNPSMNGKIYVDRNKTNPDVLDFLFLEKGTQQPVFLQSVGREEQVSLGVSYEDAAPCNEPRHMFGTGSGVDNHYSLRGYFVSAENSSGSTDWVPIPIFSGEKIVYNNISSIAVFDPPPMSPNRLIFYIGCRNETDLPYSTLSFVFASPSNIAQPFIGFRWVPANIRVDKK